MTDVVLPPRIRPGDQVRLADLNDAYRDPGVRAVIATRGGAGAYRIADGAAVSFPGTATGNRVGGPVAKLDGDTLTVGPAVS